MAVYHRDLVPLKDLCLLSVQSAISPTNVWPIYLQVLRTHCPRMEKIVHSFICDNFMDISRTTQFLALDGSAINWLLMNWDIRISEAAVFDSFVRWYKHDEEKRESDFKIFFTRVNLDQIGRDMLWEIIKKYKLLEIMPELREYKRFSRPQRANFDELMHKENVSNIAIVGCDHDASRIYNETQDTFDVQLKYWTPSTSKTMSITFSIDSTDILDRVFINIPIPVHNSLYVFITSRDVVDATKQEHILLRIDVNSHSTTRCAATHGLCCHALTVPCGIFIYFLGGRNRNTDVNTVCRFDTVKNNWIKMQPMLTEHSLMTACAISFNSRYLYVFDQTCEKYDICTDTWTLLIPPWDNGVALPNGEGQAEVLKCVSAESWGDRILISLYTKFCTGYKLVCVYDPIKESYQYYWKEKLPTSICKYMGNNFAMYFKRPTRMMFPRPGEISVAKVDDNLCKEKKLASVSVVVKDYLEYRNMIVLSRRARVLIEQTHK